MGRRRRRTGRKRSVRVLRAGRGVDSCPATSHSDGCSMLSPLASGMAGADLDEDVSDLPADGLVAVLPPERRDAGRALGHVSQQGQHVALVRSSLHLRFHHGFLR